ncbi:riboflavin synthase, partial [Clostridium perfringens]
VLAYKKAGDTINLECDILGKYVDHLLHYGSEGAGSRGRTKPGISRDYLAEHGFA